MKRIPGHVLGTAEKIIIDTLGGSSLDLCLRRTLKKHDKWDGGDRKRVVESCHAYFRWLRWLKPRDPFPIQMRSALTLQDRFDRHPGSFPKREIQTKAVPDWLRKEIKVTESWTTYLQAQPCIWLRMKKANLVACQKELPGASVPEETTLPGCLKWGGQRDLYTTHAYQEGWFEIQDIGSQLVGWICRPKPGQKWLDLCAGEGGKTLHLAEFMEGKGVLYASDRSSRKLARLRQRCKKAGVQNYQSKLWDVDQALPWKFKFDGVLVDAPCSGVGVWHRHPDARWSTQPSDVSELSRLQLKLLEKAGGTIRKGGRLIYAVCTMTRLETEAVIAQFLEKHPEFSVETIEVPLPETHFSRAVHGLYFIPETLQGNGMYVASLKLKG